MVVGLLGAAVVLRQPAIYQALAEIKITPPRFDEGLSIIIEAPSSIGRDEAQQYISDWSERVHSKSLIEEVVRELGPEAGPGDPTPDIKAGLTIRRIPSTTFFQVFLEGRDPERVAKILNALLRRLKEKAREDSLQTVTKSMSLAGRSLEAMNSQLGEIDEQIAEILAKSPEFTPDNGGQNLVLGDFLTAKSLLMQRKVQYDELNFTLRQAELWPGQKPQAPPSPHAAEMAELLAQHKQLDRRLKSVYRTARNPNSEPYAKHLAREMSQLLDEIEELRRLEPPPKAELDLGAMHLAHAGDEIRKQERELAGLQEKLKASMPEFQRYLGLLEKRGQLEDVIAETQQRLQKFEMAAESQKESIDIIQPATDPVAPIRPNRPLAIALAVVFGLLLGVGLVCLLESLDHSVKVPEQLTAGLTLPLFGVVPRMRRLSQMQLGGHLWTPGVPASLEADAFRNLRASLLGADRPDHPIVTLLVTSAKGAEGKSTVALNLAATCAKAGERTILVDCDLRRPSLGEVFGADSGLGLADVLQGLMPWQRAVVKTPIPNLSFLPAGDMSGVPIEILGSLELRQLIAALSGHFHRVILDGPAVLGLADCRMLGQVVDATLLVVRSGAHELRPLRRAKEMLEQSRVKIAGVVFNGLSEDLHNWSCDGPGVGPAAGSEGDEGRGRARGQGLDAPHAETVGASADATAGD
jgi:capsular exopolysaccharide synthesis family protein